jgi:hypothetical protein
MSRKYLNDPDNFFYVCGDLTFQDQQRSLTPLIKKHYELYFGRKVGVQDENWAPTYLLFDLCETSDRLG